MLKKMLFCLSIISLGTFLCTGSAGAKTVTTSTIVFKGPSLGKQTVTTSAIVFKGMMSGDLPALWNPNRPGLNPVNPHLTLALTVSPSTLVVSGTAGGTATFTIEGGSPPYQVTADDPAYPPSPASVQQSGGAFTVVVSAGVPAKTVTYSVTDTKNGAATALLSIALSSQGGTLKPGMIGSLPIVALESPDGVVEKAIRSLKFDVLSPRENHTYYHPVQFRVIMPVTTRKIHLRIGKKDPDTNTWDTEWMLWSVEKEDFIDKGGYFLWQKSLALPPSKYYFIARPHSIEHVALGQAASDKDGIQFRVAPLSEKLHVSPEAAERILRPHIVVHRLSQSPPWHPGENHSVRWSRTGFKVPGKVRIFLVRGKGLASLSGANRYEWSPPGGVANTGYWRRNLPKHIRPDEHYRVLIESVDNPEIRGLSEFFPIRMKMNAGVLKGKRKELTAPPPVEMSTSAKPGLPPGKKPPVVIKKLWLKNPRGMETWYIGRTYPIKWKSTGLSGRIRIILKDKAGKERILNGMMGTKIGDKHFSWKIGSNIQPGSMYRIYLKTVDGKVKSHKSGGFNIHRVYADKAKKILRKKNKPKLKKPPKGAHIQLH